MRDLSAALAHRGTFALPEGSVADAIAQMESRDPAGARLLLRALLPTGSQSADLWSLCGQCSLRLGEFEDAAREFSEAIGREALAPHLRGRAAAWRGMEMHAHAAADETLADTLDSIAQ